MKTNINKTNAVNVDTKIMSRKKQEVVQPNQIKKAGLTHLMGWVGGNSVMAMSEAAL